MTHSEIFHHITHHIVRIHNDKKWKQTLHLFCRLRKKITNTNTSSRCGSAYIYIVSLVRKKSCIWCWFLFFFFFIKYHSLWLSQQLPYTSNYLPFQCGNYLIHLHLIVVRFLFYAFRFYKLSFKNKKKK